MPKALVHLHPDTLNVLGVWLSPTSSAYLNAPAGAHVRTVGEQIMADRGLAVRRALAVSGMSSGRGASTRPGARCRRAGRRSP